MKSKKAKAFAPASVSNVAVGFDLLGFSFEGVGDEVELEWNPSGKNGVTVTAITSKEFDVSKIPKAASKNTAAVAVQAMMNNQKLKGEVQIKIKKGIPLASGMGGSAASAVAAVVAMNSLLEDKCDFKELLHFALEGEKIASGGVHLDNVLPCLRGGMNLVASHDHLVQIKVPKQLLCVLVHPSIEIETKKARGILSKQVPLELFVKQAGYLGGFLSALATSDWDLMKGTLKDVIIEPQRKKLIAGFDEAQKAALEYGALGFSISGSGPTVFALTNKSETAEKIKKSILKVFQGHKLTCESWIAPVESPGAHTL
jgi:homoserine kinase